MLVTAVAFVARSMLVAEPDASRAIVAAGGRAGRGPVRHSWPRSAAALGGGAVLGIIGTGFTL